MAGRLTPAERAARTDRLAGDDLRHGDPLVHRIGVHEPRHHLLVGAHVGRHDVDPRADERDHLLHVAARHVLQFARRKRRRVDRHAALAAAIRQFGEGAFPAHPDRQRRDFAEVDVGPKTRAALGRAERQVMLNAEALKNRGAAVIPMDRHRDDDGALGQQQPVALVERDVEMVGDDMELVARHGEDRSGKQRHRGVPRCGAGALAANLCPPPRGGQIRRSARLILRKNGFRSADISAMCRSTGFTHHGSPKHDGRRGDRFPIPVAAFPRHRRTRPGRHAGRHRRRQHHHSRPERRPMGLPAAGAAVRADPDPLCRSGADGQARRGDRQGPRPADPRTLWPVLGLVFDRHADRLVHRRAAQRILRHRRRRGADGRSRAGVA